jgi:hypothetical protein
MAFCDPYHTNSDEYPNDVHHNRDDCYEGKKIKDKHRIENSTGNKPLCKICKEIAEEESAKSRTIRVTR